jgi:predicted enzyme related to lactoylglutathione lyase
MPRHHSINYVEIAAPDLDAAMRFYGDVFGWQFTAYGPAYAGIHAGEGEFGGLNVAGSPGCGGPLVIVYSDDLDATLAAVTAAGGVAQDPYVFPGGRRFHFTDPAGNEFAAWATH